MSTAQGRPRRQRRPASVFDRLQAQNVAAFTAFRASFEGREGSHRVAAELMPIEAALLLPDWRQHVQQAIACAAGYVTGQGTEFCECFLCRGLWSGERGVRGVVITQMLAIGWGGVSLVCEACCSDGSSAHDKLKAALARDFGVGDAVVVENGRGRA